MIIGILRRDLADRRRGGLVARRRGETVDDAGRTIAEWQCARLIHEFAHLNDTGEYEQLAELFTPDGVFVRPSAPDDIVSGRNAIVQHFRTRPPRFTRHLVSNILVTVETQDRARAVSYIVLHTGPSTVEQGSVRRADAKVLHGLFRDQFVKFEGAWRFHERRGTLTLASG